MATKNEVKVSVVGDVTQFNKAVNSANDTAKKFVSETTGGMRQMTGVFTNFGYLAQDLPYAAQNFGSIANNINPAINAIMYMNQETGSLGATMAMIAKNMLSPVGLIFLLTSVLPSAIQMTMNHFNSLEKEAVKSVDNIGNAVRDKIKFTGDGFDLTFNVPNDAVALNLELMKSVVKEQERQLELAKALPQSYSDLVILGKQNQVYTKQDFEDNKNKEQSLEAQLKYYTAIKDQFQARNDLLEVQSVMERLLVMDMEGLLRASKEYADKPLITKLIGDLVELKKAGKESKEILKLQEEISKIISGYGRHLEEQQKSDQDKALEAFDDYSEKYADKLNKIKDLDIELSGATTSEKIALKKQELSDFEGSELDKLDIVIELKKLEIELEKEKYNELDRLRKEDERKARESAREKERDNQRITREMQSQWSSMNRTMWDESRTGAEKWKDLQMEMLMLFTETLGKMIIAHIAGEATKTEATEIATVARILAFSVEFIEFMAYKMSEITASLWASMLEFYAPLGPFAIPAAAASVAAGVATVKGAIGFKEGGYTGDGDPNEKAGIVHRGEYVVNAEKTKRLDRGISFIDKAVQSMAMSQMSSKVQPAIDYDKLGKSVAKYVPRSIKMNAQELAIAVATSERYRARVSV